MGFHQTKDGPHEPSFLVQWKERTNEQAIDVNFKAFKSMDLEVFGEESPTAEALTVLNT